MTVPDRVARGPGGVLFPRRLRGVFTALVIVSAVAQLVLAFHLIATAGSLERVFASGGIGMWILACLHVGLALALALLGSLMVRGKLIPAAIPLTAAALPILAGLCLAMLAQRRLVDVIAGDRADPMTLVRVMAVGTSEIALLHAFASIVAALAMLTAGVALLGSVVTIDRAQAPRRRVAGSQCSLFR